MHSPVAQFQGAKLQGEIRRPSSGEASRRLWVIAQLLLQAKQNLAGCRDPENGEAGIGRPEAAHGEAVAEARRASAEIGGPAASEEAAAGDTPNTTHTETISGQNRSFF
jgi:hypothetical protein